MEDQVRDSWKQMSSIGDWAHPNEQGVLSSSINILSIKEEIRKFIQLCASRYSIDDYYGEWSWITERNWDRVESPCQREGWTNWVHEKTALRGESADQLSTQRKKWSTSFFQEIAWPGEEKIWITA